jgi:hypothetical protein
MNIPAYQDKDVREITVAEMTEFTREHHYSATMPSITKICYGGFRDGNLVAAISFGHGSRPKDTIKILFPSLGTEDYLEIGKMCLLDEEPTNSESSFIRTTRHLLCKKFRRKLIFTWADGLWGKPGYVYQAANFLYGGFIWTEFYLTAERIRVHPLQLKSYMRAHGMLSPLDARRTPRPNAAQLREMGWKHIHGKMFRYIRFLCHREEQARLLAESPFQWTNTRALYPKHADLEWKVTVDKGMLERCERPRIAGTWQAGA